MEERLNDWSAAQYKEALARKTDEMAMPFRSKATKLDGKIWLMVKWGYFEKLFEIDLPTNILEKDLKYQQKFDIIAVKCYYRSLLLDIV